MDYLETDKGVDAKRVAIMGVSRLGKTVLWAGARDTRFALVIASCSGEGGAALSRAQLRRDHQASDRAVAIPVSVLRQLLRSMADHVDQFPVDAHMLIALIAPRRYCCRPGTRTDGRIPRVNSWPRLRRNRSTGLLGKQGLDTDQMPQAGTGRSCTRSATSCMPAGTEPSRPTGISS